MYERLKLSHFAGNILEDDGRVVILPLMPPFYSHRGSRQSFLSEAVSPSAVVSLEGMGQQEKFNILIEN
jgi:hypothetical protein